MARTALFLIGTFLSALLSASPGLAQHDLRREDLSAPPGTEAFSPKEADLAHTPGLSSSIMLQNRRRFFSFHRPAKAFAQDRLPLVIALHDGGGGPERMAEITQFNRLADEKGFLVAYPAAIDRFWNDGRKKAPGDKSIDDVGFLSGVRDYMVRNFRADPQRIYLVGLNDGGMMAMRAACAQPRAFAAIATVNAAMPEDLAAECQPNGQMPIMMIAGTADPILPFEGGEVSLFDEPAGTVLGVMQTAEAWQQNNGCTTGPKARDLADRERTDGSTVVIHEWQKCRGNADVQLYEIKRGGNTWPGTGKQLARMRSFVLGRPNMDFDASVVIWDFIAQYKRPISPFDLDTITGQAP